MCRIVALGVVGGLIGLCLICCLVRCCCKYMHKRHAAHTQPELPSRGGDARAVTLNRHGEVVELSSFRSAASSQLAFKSPAGAVPKLSFGGTNISPQDNASAAGPPSPKWGVAPFQPV